MNLDAALMFLPGAVGRIVEYQYMREVLIPGAVVAQLRIQQSADDLCTSGNLSVVPEPATAILLLAGGLAMLLRRR